jgi:hypothetical protein
MSRESSTAPKPNVDVSSRIVDGEVVVLDHTNERIHQLNATAGFVWNRLDGKISVERVAAELTKHFNVDERRALKDVRRIVAQLQQLELIIEEPMLGSDPAVGE